MKQVPIIPLTGALAVGFLLSSVMFRGPHVTRGSLVASINLSTLGVREPPSNEISASDVYLIMVNDLTVVLLVAPRDRGFDELAVIDARQGAITNRVRLSGTSRTALNLMGIAGPNLPLQRVADNLFAVSIQSGVLLCEPSLRCVVKNFNAGRFRFSPDGKRVVVGPPLDSDSETWNEFSTETYILSRSYHENVLAQAMPSEKGTYFVAPGSVTYHPDGTAQVVRLSIENPCPCGVLPGEGLLLLGQKGHTAELLRFHSGNLERQQRRMRLLDGLPWNASTVVNSQAFFGVSWYSGTRLQRLNPFWAVTDYPEGEGRFTIYSSSTLAPAAAYVWDPRPWNLHATPALSQSGKMAAILEGSNVSLYSIP